MNHISDNKHEYNVRRVDELALELTKLENELAKTTGFFKKRSIKNAIKKINGLIDEHAKEIFQYENDKLKNN